MSATKMSAKLDLKVTFTLLSLSFLSLALLPCQCIRLDEDGGYSIVIALDQSQSQAGKTPESLLSKIKEEFSSLSEWMQSSTGKFYLKQVDILLPAFYDESQFRSVDSEIGIATKETYKTADIQLNAKISTPHVRNPNGCGQPGLGIVLPVNFFQKSEKLRGKTLLPLFARYRWGVFEENGVDYDPRRYPKMYRASGSQESNWIQTSCTDSDLFNNSNNAATTSLMDANAVELDSVTEFCDESNHNKLAPTPQNNLCNYRSVMEVIRTTADWKLVANNENRHDGLRKSRSTTFKLLKTSDKPYLYLLVDKSISSSGSEIVSVVRSQVSNLITYLDPTVVAKIGAFPSVSGSAQLKNVTSPTQLTSLKTIIDWNVISDLKQSVAETIAELFAAEGIGNDIYHRMNFASALFELSKELQALSHPAGTVVFILAAEGAMRLNPHSLRSPHTLEHEIIASLKTAGVTIHAIEVSEVSSSTSVKPNSRTKLQSFVKRLGGNHLLLTSTTSNQEERLRRFVKGVEAEFKQDEDDHLTQETIVIYKGFTNGTREGSTYHAGANLNNLQLYLSSEVPLTSVMINDMDYSEAGSVRYEWDGDGLGLGGFRHFHHSELSAFLVATDTQTEPITVTFQCSDDAYNNCEAYLVLIGETSTFYQEQEFDIQISTSLLHNNLIFDWTENHFPFHVYAELDNDWFLPGRRVELTGIVCTMDDGTYSSICSDYPMIDDGNGEPDILKNDQIYSFGFIPNVDGRHLIKVVCNVYDDQDESKLLLTRTFDYDSIVTFANTRSNASDTGLIRRISDLRVAQTHENGVELEWTAPLTYGNEMDNDNLLYDLRYSPDYSELLSNFENCRKPRVIPGPGLPKPLPGGTKQKVNVAVGNDMDGDDEELYFAIRTKGSKSSSGIQSEASNLVSSRFVSPLVEREPRTMFRIEDEASSEEATQSTTDYSSESSSDLSSGTGSDITTTTTENESESGTPTSQDPITTTTQIPTTTSTSPSVVTTPPGNGKPEDELFFKKPVGYITAAAGGTLILAGLGGSLGYLYWKRKRLIDSGRLKLVDSNSA